MTNGTGTFKVSSLRKGQYAFANGDISLNIEDVAQEFDFTIYPSTASSFISLDWPLETDVDAISIYDSSGRCVKRVSVAVREQISVVELPSGSYIAALMEGRKALGSKTFVVK